MAIDKAVDSAVLDAGLTSIADAIRAKAGTSDKLASPAGFADAIAAITAGGEKIFKTEIIPESDVTSTSTMTIDHNLGETPNFAILVCGTKEYGSIPVKGVLVSAQAPIVTSTAGYEFDCWGGCISVKTVGTLSSTYAHVAVTSVLPPRNGESNYKGQGGPLVSATSTQATIRGSSSNSIPVLPAGIAYKVILGVVSL